MVDQSKSSNSMSDSEEVEVHGKVRFVTYRSPEGEYAVINLDRLDRTEAFTAVGPLGAYQVGERLCLIGSFGQHPRFGKQLKVSAAYPIIPTDAEAISEYLLALKIKGVGERMIARVVEIFGDQTLDVISDSPERLDEVPKLSTKKREALTSAVQSHSGQQEVMLFLHQHQIGPVLSARIWALYKTNTLSKIKENPYQLIQDIDQFGFLRADQLARQLGWPSDSAQRAEAALEYFLQLAFEDGHCCLPSSILIQRALGLIGHQECCEEALATQIKKRRIIEEKRVTPSALYLPFVYVAEVESAQILRLLCVRDYPVLTVHWKRLEADSGHLLAVQQREAIVQASKRGVLLLTGGPGTGKTTTLRGMISLFEHSNLDVLLAAPTGRAARRMSEATGKDAKTIHRMLEYQPSEMSFLRDEHNPLEGDVIIIDEVSMVDLTLFAALLHALPQGARLVLVGDADQLPSVGAGRVLYDLLTSALIPTVRLVEVFRQAEESLIIINAHRLLKGLPPLTTIPMAEELEQGLENGHTEDILQEMQSSESIKLTKQEPTDDLNDEHFIKDTNIEDDSKADESLKIISGTVESNTDKNEEKQDHTVRRVNAHSITKDHSIKDQIVKRLDDQKLMDFYCIPCRTSEHGADILEELVTQRNPSRFGVPSGEVQVLTPMYRGHCGADAVNARLQAVLNEQGKSLPKFKNFKVGDKVMQLKNNYDKDVFNGDVGHIISATQDGALIDFEGRLVNYTTEDLRQITLSYACSIHKSQGSEYPAVVIPLFLEHKVMLQRDLLYTAMTRGRKLVILLCQNRALKQAALTLNSDQRFGLLGSRLKDEWGT